MKLEKIEAYSKILEYLIRLHERKENGTTLYQITKDAFIGTTVQKESRIKEFLRILILKNYVSLVTMGDGREYYNVTQYGIDFYKNKMKEVLGVLYSDQQYWNNFD
jgi:hypothetical protein